MGLIVNQEDARTVLDQAADWADSERPVPEAWIDWTNRIDASPSKTFTVALGTAILAKATNPKIDALALKATSGSNAYSARTVAHKVLVPGAVRRGYDLRATGREPLNNQPFFRYDRIDEIDRIHSNARPFLPELVAACSAVNALSPNKAQAALAAFLRVRMGAARRREPVDVLNSDISMQSLLERTEDFVISKPEGGRRGQAFVAAAFDLAWSSVRSSRINDPSRRFPGDVQILDGPVTILAVEVRQKEVSYIEALQFAETARNGDVRCGLMVMLAPDQQRFDELDLFMDAESMHGITLDTIYGVQGMLISAAVWCGKPLTYVLAEFPRRMVTRLEEIDADEAAVKRWASSFDQLD
jgi:hypothetical protein